jgi:hypothetical protein
MITTVRDNQSLNEAILFLERKQESDLYLLKEHFEFTKEQLNPIKIIKDEFSDAISAPNLTGKIVKGAVGLLSGFVAKKFVIGSGAGIVGKIAGPALQAGVTGLIMKNVPNNMESIKDNGISMLQKGLSKLKIK